MAEGLRLRALHIKHGDRPLLELDLTVPPATILSVMGPSGVGKSTLLAAITGQMSADFSLEGKILLNGRDLCPLPPQARRVGILFQDHLLFPHLGVGANLAFGLAPRVRGRARRTRIKDALAEVGLEGFHDRDPETLSGGQKARVALMRMLLSEPDLLLLDEPFSRLDATLRSQMRDLVFTFARDRALPVLMVTHDAADAEAAGGPIVQLEP
ncbi:ATP-binding cassette domain-containing protein [Tritonibacter mobilis]|uniref:ATP-binding cassette domain-containing protein n=1 Tax=Tritonibacter mobilis TaxID=379347 RepID=UPI00140260A4|nr:ATP-binding cassette domain-containing protein [Tritonibacter mobilis]NHM19597.1 ATP-binding cassette domain-containing protein [Tritonibacter mobilis]NHM23746.1 ATP-binding cassette domain-containing protein [Tritonibacter mobilis]